MFALNNTLKIDCSRKKSNEAEIMKIILQSQGDKISQLKSKIEHKRLRTMRPFNLDSINQFLR